MSEQKLSTEEALRLKSEGKIGKVDIDVDANNPEARKFVQEILKKKDEQQTQQPDLADKKIQVYKRFGDSRALDCSTVEELRDLVTQIIDERAPRQTPAGSAPMNSQQMGFSDDLYKRKFSSDKEMVDALLTDMHSSDPQKAAIAKSYYDKMLGIWVRDKRQKQGLDGFYDPNRIENLPVLKDVNGFKVPVDPSEGDIGRIQKAWRMERKRKAEEGAIQ